MLFRSLVAIALLMPGCSGPAPLHDAPPAREVAAAAPIASALAPDTGDTRTMGRADAPVAIYEMSDFQCPFCRRYALETLPTIEREYIATGKVRYTFINFPITQLHPNAVPAAELGVCAARQGKFWPMHNLLFETQDAWAPLKDPRPALLGLSDSLGMDRTKTLACLADSTTARTVEAEATAAARAGATATPSFYIEGGLLVGAQPIEVFRPILDSIIAAKKP